MGRKLIFSGAGWQDYESWANDRKIVRRINALLKEAMRDPTEGIGKPKALSGDLKGFWSRRIDGKHRLVYRYAEDRVEVVACRSHYDDD